MNILLLDSADSREFLPHDDPRAAHLLNVVRLKQGQEFCLGVINGPSGKALITHICSKGIHFQASLVHPPALLPPIHLLVGLPRPQTARKILQEATAFGVESFLFFNSSRGDPGYASSSLWKSDEWERHIRLGVEQSFSTCLPRLSLHPTLQAAIDELPMTKSRIALDVYEAVAPLSGRDIIHSPVVLAIGSERGWSPSERTTLRESHFSLRELGSRVLRTETACIASLSRVIDAISLHPSS